ncbi:hypothetical protein IG631_16755 [Alternaria alternata]|nr:hypothetical protein IG631_16755 [Alternaria alternata]
MANGKTRGFSFGIHVANMRSASGDMLQAGWEIRIRIDSLQMSGLTLRKKKAFKTFYPTATTIATAIFLIKIPLALERLKTVYQVDLFPFHRTAQGFTIYTGKRFHDPTLLSTASAAHQALRVGHSVRRIGKDEVETKPEPHEMGHRADI